MKRLVLLSAALLLSTVLSLAPLLPSTASAAVGSVSDPAEQLERWLLYRGMRACLQSPDFNRLVPGNDNGTISTADLNEGKLPFEDRKEGFGYLAPTLDGGNDNDGTVRCDTNEIWTSGAAKFGFSNVTALFCQMNRELTTLGQGTRITPSNQTDCESSTELAFDGGGGSIFQQALTKALENGGDKTRPHFTLSDNGGSDYNWKALYYLLGKRSLEVFCGDGAAIETAAKDDKSYDGNNDIVSVHVVTDEGDIKKSQSYATANTDRNESSKVDDVYWKSGGNENEADDVTCSKMAEWTRDAGNAEAYAAYVKARGVPEQEVTVEAGDAQVCTAGALGWVICPLVNFIADINDSVYDVVENMLYTNPDTVKSGGALYTTWSRFRDLANVLFVIIFLIVVFSQATSTGLSSYGIKRTLPRIIAAAILVNISFFICQVAVDLSNVTGVGVTQLVGSLHSSNTVDINQISWSTVITAAIAGAGVYAGVSVALAAGGIGAAIAMLLPFAVTALFAIITALVVLIARQALIVLLVALAPIAFIAIILPNTQKYFQIWQNSFTTMLIMFPLVALLFSGSKLASNIILTSPTDGNEISYFALIAAVSILFLPLFGIPYIVKFSGGVLGRVAGVVNNPNKGPFDALRKRAEGYRDEKRNLSKIQNMEGGGSALKRNTFGRYQRRQARKDAIQSNIQHEADSAATSYLGKVSLGQDGVSGKQSEAFNRKMAGGAYNPHLSAAMRQVQASAVSRVDKEFEERVAAAATLQKFNNMSSDAFDAMAQGKTSYGGRDAAGNPIRIPLGAYSDEERVAAGRWVMDNGNFDQRRQLYDTISADDKTPDKLRQSVSQKFFAKGDNAIMGSAFGGKLLDGLPNAPGANMDTIKQEVAKNIIAGKVNALSLAHDADATKLIAEVMREGIADPTRYQVEIKDSAGNVTGVRNLATPEVIESVRRAANEAQTNTSTRTKVGSDVFKEHIDKLKAL